VTLANLPAGVRGVSVGGAGGGEDRLAARSGGEWSVVLDAHSLRGAPRARGRDGEGRPWELGLDASVWVSGADGTLSFGRAFRLRLLPECLFEPVVLVVNGTAPPRAKDFGLAALGAGFRIEPRRAPLRRPAAIEVDLPDSQSADRVDLYRRDDDGGWSAQRARIDASGRLRAEITSLGTFALFRDEVAPAVALQRPARVPPATAYPRWELSASVAERGSGVDATQSAFTVDGVRVPSEWDSERGELRWRPLRVPAPGAHAVRVRVVDRAGNATEREGRFVLDSASR
jgi:hypothetical protein